MKKLKLSKFIRPFRSGSGFAEFYEHVRLDEFLVETFVFFRDALKVALSFEEFIKAACHAADKEVVVVVQ